MQTKNKNSTRYYSNIQEIKASKECNSYRQSNSGAGHFNKGDLINKNASLLIECKTCTDKKTSFSIKEEWLKKNKEEAFTQRVSNSCLCFNFGPNEPNYYIIDSKLMKYLIEKLEEDVE